MTAATVPGGPLPADNGLFRRLVESVNDYAIFALDREGYIRSWNPGARNIKQYTADEAIGRHFSMFYEADAVASGWPEEELRRAVAHGRLEDEGWRLRKDGSKFWANVTISPLYGDAGELLGFSKVTRDLTDRQQQALQLRDSERSLRLLLESVQDYAIFMLDPSGIIRSWNPGAQRIKGYTADEVIGQPFSIFYTPEAKAIGWPEEELRRAQLHGRFEDEGWRRRADGSLIWANVVITAVKDERGELIGFSKVTRDLTERRKQEERLRESEERLRLIVDGVKDHAMYLLGPDGRILSWNSGAQRMFGHELADVLGRHIRMLDPEDVRDTGKVEAEMAAAVRAGICSEEGWKVNREGRAFWTGTTTSVLHDDNGALKGFVQIIRDLSDRQRIIELETEGRRLLEFIAMLSHELRNPLAPIRSSVAILKSPQGPQHLERCADMIGRQVTHLTRLVDDLLDVSRITTGKIELQRTRLEVNTLARVAFDSMRPTLESYGHTHELVLAPQPCFIDGDAVRLTQVIVNLLTNAAKYTPAHGHIELRVAHHGGLIRLQVMDNGVGMSKTLIQCAFEPFVQGERSLDRSGSGLGIGLTLVKTIVQLHGGSVVAASAGAGKGSCFTVTLQPCAPEDEPPSRISPEDAQPAQAKDRA